MFSRDASQQGLRLGHTWSSLAPQRPPPEGMTLPSAPTPASSLSAPHPPPKPREPEFSLAASYLPPASRSGPRPPLQPQDLWSAPPNLQQDEGIVE